MFGLKLLFLIAIIGGVIYGLIALFKPGDKEQKALLTRCRNDQAQADRLIAHEVERNPKLDRNAAAKAALESLRRDNG
jgi:hypothetical protein